MDGTRRECTIQGHVFMEVLYGMYILCGRDGCSWITCSSCTYYRHCARWVGWKCGTILHLVRGSFCVVVAGPLGLLLFVRTSVILFGGFVVVVVVVVVVVLSLLVYHGFPCRLV